MIRLLALDIDDTLVNSSHQISETNRRAIADALAHHVKIVLATGRNFLGTKDIRDTLMLQNEIIVYGGAVIINAKTGDMLRAEYLDDADVKQCFSIADRYGLHAQIYEGDTVIFREDNAFTQQYTSYLHLPYRIVPQLLDISWTCVPKVLIYSDPSLQNQYLALLQRELPPHLHVLTSKPGFLEVGKTVCTKGTALCWLADYLGIAQEEVAAIGDNTLDLDMIRWAGMGCCVANGNALVKQNSDLVLPSNDEDGVAYFIRTYILGS